MNFQKKCISDNPEHYKISQLEQRIKLKQFEVLPDTFNNPGVPRSIIVETETSPFTDLFMMMRI